MFRNYLIFTWRNLTRHKLYSILNVFGLSIAVTFITLISWYAWTEWRQNRDLLHAENQYILQSKWKDPNQGMELTTFGPLAKQLARQYPTLVKNYYRWDGVTTTVSSGEKIFREGLQLGDSTLLTMYGLDVLAGDPHHAFDQPYSLVLTDKIVHKYFNGIQNYNECIGKKLTLENFNNGKHEFSITAIIKLAEPNSVTKINANNENQFYISTFDLKNYFGRELDSWLNQYIVGYIELQPGISPNQLKEPMQKLIRDNTNAGISSAMTPYLVNLQDYHLNANNGLVKKTIYALSIIALFILLMAVVNFINLALSRSASRLKEIGVRKTLGSAQHQLSMLFLIESIMISVMAVFLGIGIAIWFKPVFENILNSPLASLNSIPFYFILFPMALIVLISIISGLYPSLSLASSNVVDSLKGKLGVIGDKSYLRHSLVLLQFITSILVFLGSLFISRQIQYAFNKDLGFNKDYIVYVPLPRDWSVNGVRNVEAKRESLSKIPQIKSATVSYEIMNGSSSGSASVFKSELDSTQAISADIMTTDEYFAETYNLKMEQGDYLTHAHGLVDSTRIVINETAAKALGFDTPSKALNQRVSIVGAPVRYQIIGVVRDFNFGGIKNTIQPIIILHNRSNLIFRFLSCKIYPGNVPGSIESLQREWNKLFPGAAFEYKFLDDAMASMYSSELQLRKATSLATFLSIIIVLLGVIGIVSINIQKRTKEIGIRKVLGAPVPHLVSLFAMDFIKIIFLSGMIAFPLAYIMIMQWLQTYAYKIEISFIPFAIVLISILTLTVLVIGSLTIKTALKSPSNSLRTE